ncbi:hypothetical protein LguiB_019191 [Lonicera macranthoides]
MGKGGGCVPSKKKPPPVVSNNAPASVENSGPIVDSNPAIEAESTQSAVAKLKIFVVFYSMYGHVEGLARRMKKGVDCVDGVEALLFRVPETLPDEVLVQMRAPPKDDEIPEISSAAELVAADGFLFGFPTRYGCMAAQMKAFFDSTGQLWNNQSLAGKPAGFFVSTGTQGGGQETTAKHRTTDPLVRLETEQPVLCVGRWGHVDGHIFKTASHIDDAVFDDVCPNLSDEYECVFEAKISEYSWTAITQLAHHGMLFVPIGYTFGAGMFSMESIRGGSPYGAGVFAGDGTREPTETELALAEHQGKYMAAVVKKLAQA